MAHKKPELHARLPQQEFDKLLDIAQEQSCSLSELTRRIISDYLQTTQYFDDDNNVVVDDSPVDTQRVLDILKDDFTDHSKTLECTPKDCVTKNQGSLSQMLLTQLELYLDGFVCETEDVTGEYRGYAWGFGLDASDEYFETAEDCLNNFLQYLNGLNFSYKASNTLVIPEAEAAQDTNLEKVTELVMSLLPSPSSDIDDDDTVDW